MSTMFNTDNTYYVSADITHEGERKTLDKAWVVRVISKAEGMNLAKMEVLKQFPEAEIHNITLTDYLG